MVHGTIAYVIGDRSQTVYSYRLDRDKWNKHSECPHVNPGLVIINDLLTAVGGRVGDGSTEKLTTLTRNNWVETFPPMQTPRVNPAVVHYGDYVIAVGGNREERVELLHIPSLLWSTVTSLPSPLSDITATLCHDEIIAMDRQGCGWTMNIELLLSSEIQLEGSSTALSQWTSLPKCPVGYGWYVGSTLSSLSGQPLVVSYDGIFQLQERQWVRIGDMPVPRGYCIVCVVCDQMVVVGGLPGYPGYTSTDAVRVAVIV